MKKFVAVLLAALMTAVPFAMTSCGGETADPGSPEVLKHSTEIVLNGDSATCESSGVYIDGGKISITSAGTYQVTGTLNNGQIYVDCIDAGKIELVLNNANITNSEGACIFFKKAQEVELTLLEGTTNTLTDGENYIFDNPEDDEPDAPLFSKEDMIIDGSGSLIVKGNYANGIVSKDGLKIDGGTIEIDAVNHGIKGKDYLVINGGDIKVHAIGDGIKSTNYDNDLVGYIEINDGTLDIYSEDEAVQAVSAIRVNGGTTNINTINNGFKCVAGIEFNGGSVILNADDNALDAADVAVTDACTVTINGTPYQG